MLMPAQRHRHRGESVTFRATIDRRNRDDWAGQGRGAMAISAIGRFADEPTGAVSLAASGGGIAGVSLESLLCSCFKC